MGKISVLFPSRGRPESLIAAVNSLRHNASSPAAVEILVAADPDDPATVEAAKVAKAWWWTAPERYGYARLHEYYNRLAAEAHGDWLLLWNDDATMLTQGWDQVIAAQDPAILWLGANHAPGACMFPAWPKAWTDATGHVSLSPHNDTWLQWLGQSLGLIRKIPVEMRHDRADVTGGHDDATYAEGRALIGPEGMVPGGIPDRDAIERDAEIIRALLAARS